MEGGKQRSAFWERSWRAADMQRLADYAQRLDPAPDAIITCLKARSAVTVCDAGCGCGVYARKLLANGFRVSGFDISPAAAALARSLLTEHGCAADAFRAADILRTPYPDAAFDAVVARDVIDHMPLAEGAEAVRELLRITRPGGCLLLTLDGPDAEYEAETHTVNADGDYLFTDGRWRGMVFHPYTEAEIPTLTQAPFRILDRAGGGFTLAVEKP